MEALIIEPIRRIATVARVIDTVTCGLKSYPTLIVIDGLDECPGLDVQDEIIRAIGNLVQKLGLPLRFLISGRLEPNICGGFGKLQSRLSKDSLSRCSLPRMRWLAEIPRSTLSASSMSSALGGSMSFRAYFITG